MHSTCLTVGATTGGCLLIGRLDTLQLELLSHATSIASPSSSACSSIVRCFGSSRGGTVGTSVFTTASMTNGRSASERTRPRRQDICLYWPRSTATVLMPHDSNDVKHLSLEQASTHLLEECRMVLPGIQALFGFQLVAVFSNRFADALRPTEQLLHLIAITCVVLAVALVMAPAVLHRWREPESVSRRFIKVSSRLLMWSMAPLAAGTVVDVYVVSRIILGTVVAATLVAAVASVVFVSLWIVLPARVVLESDGPAVD